MTDISLQLYLYKDLKVCIKSETCGVHSDHISGVFVCVLCCHCNNIAIVKQEHSIYFTAPILTVIWPSWMTSKIMERQHWCVQTRTDLGLGFQSVASCLNLRPVKAVVIISHVWAAWLEPDNSESEPEMLVAQNLNLRACLQKAIVASLTQTLSSGFYQSLQTL